jgi:hypothetical protein
VADAVFGNINNARWQQVSRSLSAPETKFGGSTRSASATACDRVVIYNYKNDTWSLGALSRSAGISDGVWPVSGWITGAETGFRTVPVMFDDNGTTVYEDEVAGTVLSSAYIESGPLMLDEGGNRVARVQKMIPDNSQTAAAETLTLYAGTWPKAAESSTSVSIPARGRADRRAAHRALHPAQADAHPRGLPSRHVASRRNPELAAVTGS